MNEIELQEPEELNTEIKIKYGQVVDLKPILDKYDFSVPFMAFVIIVVLFKYAGLTGVIKDLWAGVKSVFTYKNTMIMSLKAEVDTLKNRVMELEKMNQRLHTENVAIKSAIAPLIHYLKQQGVDNLGLEKFIEEWHEDKE